MATIDDKVVAMSFESSKFEQGVSNTISSLDKLKAALHFPEAGKGLSAIADSARRIDLGHISRGIEEVASRLNALRLTAIAVFASIVSRAVTAGTQLLKAITVQPLIQGFREYELQINSVQTILANTAAAGVKIGDVNKTLDELNEYADKTIYNFGQMTRNIGTFTAAGVDLKTATASIKGIANLAAVSGSNAQQASTAMYQLSQAISSGTVKLMDWNSVVNAGMGGTVFQRALAQTAEHMGTLKKGAVELSGPMKTVRINGESFRNSLAAGPGKDGWLSSKVLTTTLKQLSGDMTDAQLKAEGYTDAQIKAIQAQAKMALEAATQVKTFSQLLETTKEALGSGWAQTWRIVVGDFKEAKQLWTGVSQTIGDIISDSAEARNKMLNDWKKLGGRTQLIEAIRIAWKNLSMILKPIKEAFRDIFPAKTGKDLYEFTLRIKDFAKALKPSKETVENLKRTFRGFFALISIGKQIIGGILGVFGRLFGQLFQGSGGFLELTARIGDWLVKVDKALKNGGQLEKFFDHLGDILAQPIIFIQELTKSFSNLFSGKFNKAVNKSTDALSPFGQVLSAIGNAISNFLSGMGNIAGVFQPVLQAFVDGIQGLGQAVASAVSGMSFEPILQVIRTGLLAGIVVMFKRFLGGGSAISQLSEGFGAGIIGNISKSFDALSGSMKAMQRSLQAKTLRDIAIAVALLTLSIVALSMVDPKKLNNAMTAITIAFAQLLGAMSIMGKISQSMGMVKTPVVAASLILLAGAILVLSTAVIALSFLSWEELLKGLSAVGVLLGGLVVATGPLSKASPRMIAAGAALIVIGVGLNVLALAIRQLGSMDLMTLGKGLGSVGIALFIIATYMKLMPPGASMVAQGAGLVLISVALNGLALAVRQLGSMDLMTLGKGLAAIGISLALVAGAMRLMPAGSGMIASAAGLLIVGVALQGIARAIGTLGGMSVKELAKGVLTLVYTLGALAGILHIMQGTAAGAAALGVAAAGIGVLATALAFLGKQPIKVLVTGLVALAAALGIIAGIGMLLDAAAPGLLAFGAAVTLVGAGLALAGAGIMMAALGLAALAAAGPVAAGVIAQAFEDLTKAMIDNAKNLVLGLLEIVQALAETAPQFVEAIVTILESVIDAAIKLAPKLTELIIVLIEQLIIVLHEQQGPLIQAGFDLLIALLQGIRDNIGQIVALVVDIIVNFINAIKANIGRILAAGTSLMITFIGGILKSIGKVATAVLEIIAAFLRAIAGQVGKIVTAGGQIIVNILTGIAKNLSKIIKAATDVIVAFITGIGNAGPRIVTAATDTIIKFMWALQQNANKMADAAFDVMIAFLNGLADTIENKEGDLLKAGVRVGKAVVQGIINGIGEIADDLYNKAKEIVGKVKDKLEFWKSPPDAYGEWLGKEIISGFANGLSNTTDAVNAAKDVSTSVIDAFESVLEIASASKVMKRIGREVTAGFAEGIKSGLETDIRAAYGEIRRRLAEQETGLRQQIAQDTKRRNELQKKGAERTKEEKDELKKLKQALKDYGLALKEVNKVQRTLNKALEANKTKLLGLSAQYTEILNRIEEAKGLIQELKDQYDDLPELELTGEDGKELSGSEQLKRYIESLTKRIEAIRKYRETLQKLRELGLDDATYRMLLEQGTSGQEFAEALLAGGKPAIDAINALDTEFGTEVDAFGESAARALYSAGINAANGLIEGLEKEKGRLEKLMRNLGKIIVETVKKELRIGSPSKVFAEIGSLSMEGMARGIENSTSLVTDATDQAAKDALTAMERSMRNVSDLVTDQLDVNPVITPILDLSDVKAKQAELASLTAVDQAAASLSAGYAASISTGTAAGELTAVAPGGTSFKFEQNNYSPEALSDIEIYRQTKNQLSQIKSALALT